MNLKSSRTGFISLFKNYNHIKHTNELSGPLRNLYYGSISSISKNIVREMKANKKAYKKVPSDAACPI
jgi:hypothetical protein